MGCPWSQVLKDENLAQRADEMGALFRKLVGEIKHPMMKIVRGVSLPFGLPHLIECWTSTQDGGC